ncbi:unnamed protein product [Cylicocyclus nassatus]|uniref:Asparagine synthetase domain-containing protein n=1 Tax=Cylicocyclus nassatus TaxID=53992 RepID=A0AA36H1D7_CYLNA|nr:unnamed protein product [Cylicocyclus nassatus]
MTWKFIISPDSTFLQNGNETVKERVLLISGRVVKEPEELLNMTDSKSIAYYLLKRSGSWSVIYHRPDIARVFVGRDVFGRLSLVFTRDGKDIVISDIVQSTLLSGWNEVPYAQVSSIAIETSSTRMYSYLETYMEGIMDPWAKLFQQFSFEQVHFKDVLLKVSRSGELDAKLDIEEEFLKKLVTSTRSMLPQGENVAIAFSGGVDSLLGAITVHLAFPPHLSLDLINVAFIRGSEHKTIVTDRRRAIAGLEFLRSKYSSRQWRLIQADVSLEEMEKDRAEHVVRAAAPALSVLDESLACVLYYALRGAGTDYDNLEKVESQAQVYFVGSGADELFAGYARHRTRFERDGADAIPEECEAELRRLGCRNGGRDARVAVLLSKELRAPFLDDDFVAWANSLPMQLKWDLSLPRGEGEKRIIRQVLASLGAPHDAPKQAMQFGSGFVKMQNDKKLKGSDVSTILMESRLRAIHEPST